MGKIDRETLAVMLARGTSQAKIARELGVTRVAVHKMSKKVESLRTQYLFSQLIEGFASSDAFGHRVRLLATAKNKMMQTWMSQIEAFEEIMELAENEKNRIKKTQLVCRVARAEWKVLNQMVRSRVLIDSIEDLEHLIKLMLLILDQLAARDHREFRELLLVAQKYAQIKKERYENGWSLGWRNV